MGEFVLVDDMWYFQEETTVETIEPVVDAWTTYFEDVRCRISECIFRHDYTEARKLDLRVTADGVVFTSSNVDRANNDDFWMCFSLQNRLRVLTVATAARTFNLDNKLLTCKELKIELRTRETFGAGGAALRTWIQWEKFG